MKGMGGGGWGIFVKILQSHMFYEVYEIYLDHSKSVDRSVIIYRGGGGGGWKKDFWKSHGFQGNRRDQSSPKEYEMRNSEQ